MKLNSLLVNLLLAAILCPNISNLENGSIEFETDTEWPFDLGTMATYMCLPGFRLHGGTTVRTCQSSGPGVPNGTWSGVAPSCEGACMTKLMII